MKSELKYPLIEPLFDYQLSAYNLLSTPPAPPLYRPTAQTRL